MLPQDFLKLVANVTDPVMTEINEGYEPTFYKETLEIMGIYAIIQELNVY